MPYHRKTAPQFVEEAQRVHGESDTREVLCHASELKSIEQGVKSL